MQRRTLICLLPGALLLACDPKAFIEGLFEVTPEEAARKRVAFVLAGIQNPGRHTGAVRSQFYRGVSPMKLSDGENYDATVAFNRWQSAGKLDSIDEFEITDARQLDSRTGVVVMVTVVIDGKARKLRVPEGETIRWAR